MRLKIFFTESKTGRSYPKVSHNYNLVLNELKRHDIDVISTHERTYLDNRSGFKKVESLSVSEKSYKYVHDSAIKKAIFVSDAVIVEASYPSFRLGFETHFALTQQKPVLVLSTEHNYANLIDHPNFFGTKYREFTLPDEIDKFLRHVDKHKLRNRFNLFISDKEKYHLNKVAKINSISMSSYIRKLIQQDILNSLDKETIEN